MVFDDARDEAIERLRKAVQTARVPKTLRSILEDDLTAEDFQAQADKILTAAETLGRVTANLEARAETIGHQSAAVEAVGDAVLALLEHVDELEDAEGKDERSLAREGTLSALSELVDRYDEAVAELESGDPEPEPEPDPIVVLAIDDGDSRQILVKAIRDKEEVTLHVYPAELVPDVDEIAVRAGKRVAEIFRCNFEDRRS